MNPYVEIYLLDDDPVFLKTFAQSLGVFLEQQSVAYHMHAFTGSDELLQQAEKEPQIDLLIADICLGSATISGLSVASQIRDLFPGCSIIYLTAFLEFATEIYDTRPLYFILKEEYRQRIPAAMELFFREHRKKQEVLTVTFGKNQAVIQLQELIYCERTGRKTRLVCTEREIQVPDTIAMLADRLPQKRFAVCHKGYIVGLRYVDSYRRYAVTLRNGEEIPVSRARYDPFRTAFAAYLAE